MVLLLLIDAFRADYLECAPFLRGIAAAGVLGRFQEPFGFAPRASYFAGVTPGQAGYSHLFWFDPEASPFRAACHYPDPRQLRPGTAAFVREQVRKAAAAATTPYAASYVHPLAIPFRLLPWLDVPEKYPPWDTRCGYSSLFHEMDLAGGKWLYAGWPVLNDLGLRDDGQIVSWVLEHAKPEHDLVFVQLCELDAVAHVYGPESGETLRCLGETDRLARVLVEGLACLGGSQHLIVFGDHGMVPVVAQVDLQGGIDNLEAKAPEDFIYFLDSTGARFRYGCGPARSEVGDWLRSVAGGRLLSAAELERYGMKGADPRNGEDYWLADPGVLIAPNFFHSGDAAPRGMHGYAPEEPDNQGVFIAAGPSIPPGGTAGLVRAERVHDLLRALVLSGTAPAAEFAAPLASSGGPATDRIANDLALICSCIEDKAPDFDALVLCGAFGRGEGSVLVEDGHARALNDYDLVVISPGRIAAVDWKWESTELKSQLGLPYLDIGWFPPETFLRPDPTIFNFDFRRGSRVLRGDAELLERMPLFAAGDIPSAEVLQLLLNRVSGLLIALRGELLPPAPLPPADREFLWLQVIKLGVAVADHHLFGWGAYHTKYAERRRRFSTLGRSAGLAAGLLAGVDLCFALKLHPDDRLRGDPRQVLEKQQPWWREALLTRLRTEETAGPAAYVRTRPDTKAGRQERIRGCAAPLWDSLTDSLVPDATRLSHAAAVMAEAGIAIPQTAVDTVQSRFEQLRAAYVAAWEAACH